MKSPSQQCRNGCGRMHRCHIKITENKIQRWLTIPWQYCLACKLMLPDWQILSINFFENCQQKHNGGVWLSYFFIFFFSEIRSTEIIIFNYLFEMPCPIFSIFLSTAFCMTTFTQSNEFIWIPDNLKRMGIVLNSQIRKIISIFIYAATRFFVIVYMVTV